MGIQQFKACLKSVIFLVFVSAIAVAQQAPSAPLTLKGPSMGAVTFSHSAHTRVAGKCEVCHHASKPEKPLKSPQQACADCHSKPPTAAVKTGLQSAFHNSSATAGLCITCHKTENAEGKAAPVKCGLSQESELVARRDRSAVQCVPSAVRAFPTISV